MPVTLLAPVPALHVESAMKLDNPQRRVAFGSWAWDVLWEAWNTHGRIPVLIAPTGSGDGSRKVVRYSAVLEGLTDANRKGRHPKDALRPETALKDDTAWGFFWEVSNLKPLDAPIGFAQLRALNQKTNLPPNYVAHGPLLVMAPELHMPLTALSA